VYVPTKEENVHAIDWGNLDKKQLKRMYKFVDSSDTTANFIPMSVASLIFNMNKKDQEKKQIDMGIQNEYGIGSPQSKNQKAITGEIIKDICIKLRISRLGNIKLS
jgi:CRISPR-associated endonuclease Csn1